MIRRPAPPSTTPKRWSVVADPCHHGCAIWGCKAWMLPTGFVPSLRWDEAAGTVPCVLGTPSRWRLRDSARPVQKKDGDLLVGLLTDINRTMQALGRLIPIHLPGRDRDAAACTTLLVFHGERVAPQYHRDPMKGVTMPRKRFA